MAKCIVRSFDGQNNPIDRITTHAEMEALAGRRLDKRKSYAWIRGGLHTLIAWSGPCSGCSEETPANRGSGCRECAYTGRARTSMWSAVASPSVPLPHPELDIDAAQLEQLGRLHD